MDKIKGFGKQRSIKTSFIIYILLCIAASALMSLSLSGLLTYGQSRITEKYQKDYDKYAAMLDINEAAQKESGSYPDFDGYLYFNSVSITDLLTPAELNVYNALGILSFAVYPLCFAVCLVATSVIFYKKLLERPLKILDEAAGHIAGNNLDFKIEYNRPNELGRLCVSFEKMRSALLENHTEMWRQIEDRKRLNAATAHDLRTPLTVLRGQSEMLIKYAPQMPAEKIISTAQMMQRHIKRLEAYTNAMSDLQRLEDIEIKPLPLRISDIINQIKSGTASIYTDKRLIFSDFTSDTDMLSLDITIMMRVYENLLSNALRFAREKIIVSVKAVEDYLYISVSDDGNGFSKQDLLNAVNPFYKNDNEDDGRHFGIGLNICSVLCNRHGGYLKLENRQGASVTASFKNQVNP